MLTPTPTPNSPAVLDIIHNDKTHVGQAVLDVSGFYYYEPPDNPGWFSSETLEELAGLLRALNAPIEKELAEYFAGLPKEISREPQDDGLPF